MLVLSPSNVLAHKKCPLQAWGQREKLIAWKESPQKQRGVDVHAALEAGIKNDFTMPSTLPDGCNVEYVTDTLRDIHVLVKEHDLDCYSEQELAVTQAFKPTTFFADDVFFRCRADLLLVKSKHFAIIGDWKTGRIYDYSQDQMRLESILVSTLYKTPIVHWKLFYVDQGVTKEGTVNYSNGLMQVADLLNTMKEMQLLARTNGPWLAKRNAFCKWCDWYHNKCTESMSW